MVTPVLTPSRSGYLGPYAVASLRLPPEPSGSMQLPKGDSAWVINNNGPEDALAGEVGRLITRITDDWFLSDAFALHG